MSRRGKGNLIMVVMLGCLCFRPPALHANALPEGKPGAGDKAPCFTAEDLRGSVVSLEENLKKGRQVVLNFWGLRCSACIDEIGYLNPLSEKYEGKGVVFLGINVDGVNADTITRLMTNMANVPRYTVLPDPDFRISDMYNMMAAPLSLVIGKGGNVVYRHEDFKPGDEKMLEKVLQDGIARGE